MLMKKKRARESVMCYVGICVVGNLKGDALIVWF